MNNNYDYLFKFIAIGDSSVGKSCLMLRFTQEKFKTEHEPTLGVEFGSKYLKINQNNIKIQIWDTAGQESFKSITRSYYKGSIGILLVYDITRRDSFDNINKWLDQVKAHSHDKIEVALIGNKIDLSNRRQVTKEQGQAFAKKNGFVFFQTSALNGQSVPEVFKALATKVLKKIESGQINVDNDSKWGVRKNKKNTSPRKDNSGTLTNPSTQSKKPNQSCSC